MDPRWLLAQFAASCTLAGLCWTVQLAIYPRFEPLLTEGGGSVFRSYHAAYTRSMGFVAAPLMLVEAALAAVWVRGGLTFVALAGTSMVVLVWALTFGLIVPLHVRLQRSPSVSDARLVTLLNWPRTLLWTARAGLLGWAAAALLAHR
ncbi:MAG: hypothetical protein NTU80_05600 [Verrucomicrobia bacterium]|nr:hypothetical protein [Verrucomicrobiota bacterium]